MIFNSRVLPVSMLQMTNISGPSIVQSLFWITEEENTFEDQTQENHHL